MALDVVTVVLDEAEITLAGYDVVDGRPWARTEPVRAPLTAPPGAGGVEIDGLLERVGDPVPVRVDGAPASGAALVAGSICRSVVELLAEPAERLVVAVPERWQRHRRAALREELESASGTRVDLVGSATALLVAGERQASGAASLVVETGSILRASVCVPDEPGWSLVRSAQLPWGCDDVDDDVLDFVRARSSQPWSPEDGTQVRQSCRRARRALTEDTATEVALPGGSCVRLVRADLEALVAPAVAQALGQLVADVSDPEDELEVTGVLLAGPLAALPFVTEALSRATGQPVEHVGCEEAGFRYAAAAPAVDQPTEADPAVTAEADLLPVTGTAGRARRGHRRRSALAIAAAAVAASLVGGFAVAGVGEESLEALLTTMTPGGEDSPEGSGADTSTDRATARSEGASAAPEATSTSGPGSEEGGPSAEEDGDASTGSEETSEEEASDETSSDDPESEEESAQDEDERSAREKDEKTSTDERTTADETEQAKEEEKTSPSSRSEETESATSSEHGKGAAKSTDRGRSESRGKGNGKGKGRGQGKGSSSADSTSRPGGKDHAKPSTPPKKPNRPTTPSTPPADPPSSPTTPPPETTDDPPSGASSPSTSSEATPTSSAAPSTEASGAQ